MRSFNSAVSHCSFCPLKAFLCSVIMMSMVSPAAKHFHNESFAHRYIRALRHREGAIRTAKKKSGFPWLAYGIPVSGVFAHNIIFLRKPYLPTNIGLFKCKSIKKKTIIKASKRNTEYKLQKGETGCKRKINEEKRQILVDDCATRYGAIGVQFNGIPRAHASNHVSLFPTTRHWNLVMVHKEGGLQTMRLVYIDLGG